jgi:hypothetical protein
MQNIIGVQLERWDDSETLARKLINDRQHAERAAVLRLVLDEIIAPDMAGVHKRAFIVSDKRSRTRRRMHEPSFSQRRPRLVCFCGTLSPSRRQMR